MKSRSDHQLGSPKKGFSTKLCEPEAGTDDKPIVPCGLIAWSLFNDTYKLSRNDAALDINKKDIAWRSDRTKKFSSQVYPQNFQNGTIIGGAKLDETKPVSCLPLLSSPISLLSCYVNIIHTKMVFVILKK